MRHLLADAYTFAAEYYKSESLLYDIKDNLDLLKTAIQNINLKALSQDIACAGAPGELINALVECESPPKDRITIDLVDFNADYESSEADTYLGFSINALDKTIHFHMHFEQKYNGEYTYTSIATGNVSEQALQNDKAFQRHLLSKETNLALVSFYKLRNSFHEMVQGAGVYRSTEKSSAPANNLSPLALYAKEQPREIIMQALFNNDFPTQEDDLIEVRKGLSLVDMTPKNSGVIGLKNIPLTSKVNEDEIERLCELYKSSGINVSLEKIMSNLSNDINFENNFYNHLTKEFKGKVDWSAVENKLGHSGMQADILKQKAAHIIESDLPLPSLSI
jgi:hypothetical protein